MRPPPPSPLPKQRPAGQRRPAPPLHGGGNGGKGKGWKRPPAERRPRRGHGAETADRSNRVPTPRSRCVPAAPVPGCQLAAINDRPGRQSGRTLRGAVAEDAVGRGGGRSDRGTPRCGTGLSVCPSARLSVQRRVTELSVRPSVPPRQHRATTSGCPPVRPSSRPTRLRNRPPSAPGEAAKRSPSVCPSVPRPARWVLRAPSVPPRLSLSVRPRRSVPSVLAAAGRWRCGGLPVLPVLPVLPSPRPAPPRPPLTWCVLLPSTAVTPRSPPQPSPPSSGPPPGDVRRAAANATAATAAVSRAVPRGPMATPAAAAAPRPHRPRPASSPVRHAPLVNGAPRHAPSPRPRRVVGSRGRRSSPANRLHRGSVPISPLPRRSPPFSSRDWLPVLVRWVRARPSHPAHGLLST